MLGKYIIDSSTVFDMLFHFNFTVIFLQSSNPFLFNQHKQLSTEQFLLLNIGDTTENEPVLYQKLEFNGCSSGISINDCLFGECTQLSFHSLLYERNVIGCYVHHKSHLVQGFHVFQLIS